MNRPEKRNALNRQMMQEMITAIEEVGADEDTRVLVITGAGKGFCSGADTDLMPGGSSALGEQSVEDLRRSFVFQAARKLILGLQRLEKPTIAMVNGVCVGAGVDIALACDMRTGSENTRFMCGFVKIGLFPGFGATWLYPRILGLGKALELLFTGDTLGAEEAKQLGMLNKLVSANKLEEETCLLAQKIAQGPPVAIRLMKSELYRGLETDLDAALHRAAACESITLLSHDHREGISALREKREPLYHGN